RTFATIWDADLWGGPMDRALAAVLCVSALVGVCLLNQGRQRPAARLFGLGAVGLGLLSLLGITWQPLGRVATERGLVPGRWCAALPAAYAWVQGLRLLSRLLGGPWRTVRVCCAVALAAGLLAHEEIAALAERCCEAAPLAVGLGPEREALVEVLKVHTGTE